MISLEQRLKKIELASAVQTQSEFRFVGVFGRIEKTSICFSQSKHQKQIADAVTSELRPTPLRLSFIRVQISDKVITVQETCQISVDVDKL